MIYGIYVAGPTGYVHRRAFDEVADALRGALHDRGHEIQAVGIPGAKTIVLAPHLLTFDPPEGSVLYNLEQVDADSPWLTETVIARFKKFETWDYGALNANRLKMKHGVSAKVVAVGYHPTLSRIPAAETQDIDVLFYGSINDRRATVLDELRRRGARIETAFGVYGSERDALIARAKIVLNLHYYSAQVFEIVRCCYLLANRVCVVSETPRVNYLRDGIAWADYRGLADRCVELLNDDYARTVQAAIGYDAIRAVPLTTILQAAGV